MQFAQRGDTIEDGTSPDDGGAHWADFTVQIKLAKSLQTNAHRFSIDWARVEPAPGEIDFAALERYREELDAWRAAGMTTMLTLHHFTMPAWLEGGVLNPEFSSRIGAFTDAVLEVLGDALELVVTFNEPTVLSTMGYVFGQWPPGQRARLDLAVQANHRLVLAHAELYRKIKARVPDVQVGLAHHLRIFEPRENNRLADRTCAYFLDRFFNKGVLTPLVTGRFAPGLSRITKVRTGSDARHAKDTQDFVGVNYYSRDLVRFKLGSEGFVDRHIPRGAEVSDLGWEVFPDGLTDILREVSDIGLPIYITENGIADARDFQRPNFLVRHLLACLDAIDCGADLRGYFHWSLVDNFEWAEGMTGKFGLFSKEDNGSYLERRSAQVYREVIARGGIDRELRLKYGQPASSARRQRRKRQ